MPIHTDITIDLGDWGINGEANFDVVLTWERAEPDTGFPGGWYAESDLDTVTIEGVVMRGEAARLALGDCFEAAAEIARDKATSNADSGDYEPDHDDRDDY